MSERPDPKERFSDRVADYVRFRPGYPRELISTLTEITGLSPGWIVADLGAGTGLSSTPFLDHGNTVYAVEPNAEMRRAAEELLGGRPGFVSVEGSAEATGLAAASIDLAVAAQAFHWFDAAATRHECLRIVRNPGWAAVVWNVRRTDVDDFARAYESLLLRWGTDYEAYRARRIEPRELEGFFGRAPEERSLTNEQVFDYPALRGRHLSSSYVPPVGHLHHDPMMGELRSLFERHAEQGRVRFEYETQLFVAPLA